MIRAKQYLKALVVEEEGATAIEYGLLAALIAGVIVATVTTMGQKVSGLFTTVESRLP